MMARGEDVAGNAYIVQVSQLETSFFMDFPAGRLPGVLADVDPATG